MNSNMASEGHAADLSVSTGILLCYSREMSFKIYNGFPIARCKIRVALGQDNFCMMRRVCRIVEYFSSAKDWRTLKLNIAESSFQ